MSELPGQSGLALPLPYGRVVQISDIELQLRDRSIAGKRLHSIPRDRVSWTAGKS